MVRKHRRRQKRKDRGSFADRFLFNLYCGGEKQTELEYLVTRMGPFMERSEMWRGDGTAYGWFGMGCPGALDQRDNANDYSPEGPEEE